MKAINSTTITFLLLFGAMLTPSQAQAQVCQARTTIVYSNGMFNDEEQANSSKQELMKKLMISSQVFADQTMFEFKLAYVSDGSQFHIGTGNPNVQRIPVVRLMNALLQYANTVVGQPAEVMIQKILQDDWSMFWRWLGGIQSVSQSVQDFMNQMAVSANANSYLFDPDLQKQVALYRGLLKNDNRVVIVAHSQGNFYANAAYSALILNNPAWISGVGIVQVATPAASNQGSKLGNNEPQITVPEDLVMKAVHNMSLGLVMPTKPASGWSANLSELGTAAYQAATYGHSFVNWYLAGSFTRQLIVDGITQQLGSIRPAFNHTPKSIRGSFQNRGVSRCIRDDANRLGFSVVVDAYGRVDVSVSQFSPAMSTLPVYSTVLPAGVASYYAEIVPVPSGIGVLDLRSSNARLYFLDPVGNDWAGVGDVTPYLTTFTWNRVSGSWATQSSSVNLPQYQSIVRNFFCPSLGTNACSGPPQTLAPAIPAYYDPLVFSSNGYGVAGATEYPSYHTKVLFVGEMDSNLSSRWAVVDVIGGRLVMGASSAFSVPLDATGTGVVPPMITVGVSASFGIAAFNGNYPSSGNFFGPVVVDFR